MTALTPIPVYDCIFCWIYTGKSSATIVRRWPDAVAFVPRDPVTGDMEHGHVLVIPAEHVTDFIESPEVSALVGRRTAELAGEHRQRTGRDVNRITSAGSDATQTVPHYHEHLVLREADDGLRLPWTGQAERLAAERGARNPVNEQSGKDE